MNNEPKASMNLDPELLAAYIDQRLSPEQRAAVEAEFATDPDAYSVLVESLKALEGTEVSEVLRVQKVRRWPVAAGLLAAAAALAVVVRLQPDLSESHRADPQIARLVEAVGEERYMEPRLSGGFKYGPLRSVVRGPAASTPLSAELRAASSEIARRQAADPTFENQHALGVSELLLGRYDTAIVTLEPLARGAAATPQALSDLAAAYLARSISTGQIGDARSALVLTDRALEKDPALAEAVYNSAIAFRILGDSAGAANRWTELLKIESSPEWRTDVVNQLSRLQRVVP